jgi:hypothetical protein
MVAWPAVAPLTAAPLALPENRSQSRRRDKLGRVPTCAGLPRLAGLLLYGFENAEELGRFGVDLLVLACLSELMQPLRASERWSTQRWLCSP